MTKPTIGFIGQGFIGKNYANDFEKRGYKTIRYSLEPEYVSNKDNIAKCDIVFIAVPTPTTPKGFSYKAVLEAISSVGNGKIAVVKSTIPSGTTKEIQAKYPKIIVLHSPEFLSEKTAAFDASHPFSNIVGMPKKSQKYKDAAKKVHSVLPKANFSLTCTSEESELIKYAHNCSGFIQIIFFNLMYDLSLKVGADWKIIQKAIFADPLISNRYANPVHKSGRGAGGHCFIKDFATFVDMHKKINPSDVLGSNVLKAAEKKNIELLKSTKKDLDLLSGVYGQSIL